MHDFAKIVGDSAPTETINIRDAVGLSMNSAGYIDGSTQKVIIRAFGGADIGNAPQHHADKFRENSIHEPDIEMDDALRAADPSDRQPPQSAPGTGSGYSDEPAGATARPGVDPAANARPAIIEEPVPTNPGTVCQPAPSQVTAR